jgi:hypothetical protein
MLVNTEIPGECTSIIFREPSWRAAFNELLDVSGVAAKEARQGGIVFAPLVDEAFEEGAGVVLDHVDSYNDRKIPLQVGIDLGGCGSESSQEDERCYCGKLRVT